MAYTTINKSTAHFNTKLYNGTGSSNSITGVGFQPDWVWIKQRSGTENHNIFDAVRTATKRISSNRTNAEDTQAQQLTAFGADGFTVGTDDGANKNSSTYVSWNWKAGTTSGISTDSYSTITPTSYSFNATNGFSIVKYNGNGTAGAGVPHGLGVAPKMVWVKNLASGSTGWYVYHKSIGAGNTLALNGNGGASSNNTVWNGYNTDATNFYLGTNTGVNDNGTAHIAYCFAEKTGYSKIGKYKGNGSTDGTFVYTGFKPAFFLVKCTGTTDDWFIYDNKRDPRNLMQTRLRPNTTTADTTNTAYYMDFLSNGFKLYTGNQGFNGSTRDYVYMAFGQSLVGSNNVPCTAR
jgi:hypothetical protein